VQTPPPAPAPVVVPPPAPAPVVDQQLAEQRQREIDAAVIGAQSDIDGENAAFAAMADQMHAIAPDVIDFSGPVQQARGVSLPSMSSLDQVAAGRQDALNKIRGMRLTVVKSAQAKADKTAFAHQGVTDGLADWKAGAPAEPDAEKALVRTLRVIHALKLADAAWPAAPVLAAKADPAVAAMYATLLKSSLSDFLKAADQPSGEAKAVADFKARNAALGDTAVSVGAQFQAVADANDALKSPAFPPDPAAWAKLKTELAQAGGAVKGWPDAGIAKPAQQVDQVIAALGATDVSLLQTDSAAGGPPALLAAVSAKFPGVHGDADTDAAIYQNLKKAYGGSGQIPSAVSAGLSALWNSRLAAESDAKKAAHLIDLSRQVDLGSKPDLLGLAYFNGRLADLKKQCDPSAPLKQQTDAARLFLAQTTAMDDPQWSLTDSELAAVRKMLVAAKVAITPVTQQKMPANFQKVSGSDDLLYTPLFDPTHPLRFKKVKNSVSGATFYLCTTEAPIGWFIGMIDDPHKIVTLRKLMDFTIPSKLAGPSAWKTNFIRGGLEVNPDRSWLGFANHNWDSDQSRYIPPGDGPTERTPMQYVSPLAAMYVAELAGCRLPTVDEWQSAYQSGLRDNDDNNSGNNWAALRASIAGLQAAPINASSLQRFRLELGITDDTGTMLPFAGPVRNAGGQGGDVLWYRDVPANASGLHDMAGNVAEWVISVPPDGIEPVVIGTDPVSLVNEDGNLGISGQDDPGLEWFYQRAMRIGLTSTSGKNDDPAKAVIPADAKQNHHHEFYDVGFRLALGDPDAAAPPSLASVVAGVAPIGP
jgi:formylglycine-generating enzyme required for sulfatase activity